MSNQIISNPGRSATRATPNPKMNQAVNKKKNRKRKARKTLKDLGMKKGTFFMSQCARDYGYCLVDPFGYEKYAEGRLPCIPDVLDFPSRKFYSRARGVMTTSSTGFGFLSATPFTVTPVTDQANGFPQYAFTNDAAQAVSATCTNNLIQTGFGFGFLTACPSGFPTNGTQGHNFAFRCVALGIRVRYIGTELQRGGQIIPIVGRSLQGSTYNQILADPLTSPTPVDRKWHGCFYRPTDSTDTNYRTSINGIGQDTRIALCLSSTPGNNFEFEVTSYFECIPHLDAKVDSTTASHSDSTGYSFIRDMTGQFDISAMGTFAWQQIVTAAKKYAADHISHL